VVVLDASHGQLQAGTPGAFPGDFLIFPVGLVGLRVPEQVGGIVTIRVFKLPVTSLMELRWVKAETAA
jgi:hypothetical protein